MSKLEALNGHVIVRLLEEGGETTQGNIVLPHLDNQDTVIAEVISTSAQFNFNTDEWVTSWIQEGDKVLLNKMGGQRIYHESQELIITQMNTIMAKITQE
jgi:co-chaperonin GroES (HSP10)